MGVEEGGGGVSHQLFRTPSAPSIARGLNPSRKLTLFDSQRRRFCFKRSESQCDDQSTPLQTKRRKSTTVEEEEQGVRSTSQILL